jgi:hypothetical protein
MVRRMWFRVHDKMRNRYAYATAAQEGDGYVVTFFRKDGYEDDEYTVPFTQQAFKERFDQL